MWETLAHNTERKWMVNQETAKALGTSVDYLAHQDGWQTGFFIRAQMRRLTNNNSVFENDDAFVEAEQRSFRFDQLVSYESNSGHMYLVEGNERMNNTTIGFSHVEVEGPCTLRRNGANHREMLFVLQPGGVMPRRGTNRGIDVTRDEACARDFREIGHFFAFTYIIQIDRALGRSCFG